MRHRGFAVSSADLNVDSMAIVGGGDEMGSGKRDDDVSDQPSQGERGETWRIEDYEGFNDYAKRPGPGLMSFANVRLTFGPAAKTRRPTITGVPGDDSFIKNILLKQGRRSTANEAMLSSATNRARESAGAASDSKRQKSAFAPLFGILRKGSQGSLSSSEHEDKYYSHQSIHLNREDGVDIGELRRELELAMKTLRRSSI